MTKRDNDYIARRLQRDNPQIWIDFQAGVYKTLAEARRAAGLGGQRTRLHEMKNAWRKATDEQRDEFLAFLDAEGVTLPLPRPTPAPAQVPTSSSVPTLAPTPTPTSTAGSSTSAPSAGVGFTFARGGYLTPEAKDRIKQIIDRRGLRGRYGSAKTGVIMRELQPPFSPSDPSLGSALARGTSLKKDMIEALERWVEAYPPL